MRTWTDAAKTAQREAIRRWQPWTKSTGPKTPSGKCRSSQNARRTEAGQIRRSNRILAKALKVQRQSLQALKVYWSWKKQKNSAIRTIMMARANAAFNALSTEFYHRIAAWADFECRTYGQETPLLYDEGLRMAA